EAVLRGLFRVGAVACDEPGGPHRDGLMCSHELLVGGRVSPLRAGDELRLGHSGRPTTVAYTTGLSVWFHRGVELHGATCLVTGSSSGIGRATAAALVASGGEVFGSGVEDVDLSVPGAPARLAAAALDAHGRVDVLVNCAGAGQYGPVENADA